VQEERAELPVGIKGKKKKPKRAGFLHALGGGKRNNLEHTFFTTTETRPSRAPYGEVKIAVPCPGLKTLWPTSAMSIKVETNEDIPE